MTDSLASRAAKGTATVSEMMAVTPIGDPPDDLSGAAKAEWIRCRGDLERLGVADVSLRPCLYRMCQDYELIQIAHHDLMANGPTIDGGMLRGRPVTKPSPWASILSAAGTRYQAALSSLCLTVASQAKIKPKAATELEDPIQKQLGKYD
jgi:phage terminase small subunit